jgi:hypothetical protein
MKSDNPLSLIDVGRSALFTSIVMRIFRGAWVLAANTFVAWGMFTRLRSVGFPALNFQLCFEFVFEVILPIIGIVLELVNWKFARWVNVGCFTVAGCFWLAAAVWWRSDPFFGVLLIIALGLLAIAGITEIFYRGTRSAAHADFKAFDKIMSRRGGKRPRAGDELSSRTPVDE